VELVDEKREYTSAVDMWSFGILTACLLTGQPLFPRGRVTQVSQVEVAARILGTDDSQVKEKWQQLSPRAEKFLRRLLVVKPEDRLTADQALNHSWYTKPPTEATLLEQGYQRIIRFWNKRQSDDTVIENLPKKTFVPQTSQFDQPAPKLRRGKLPDTTMSPYFGLDRHLNPFQKPSSKRKAMIDDLKESGLHFVNSKEHHKIKTVTNSAARLAGPVRVISVEARDLFRTSNETVDAAQHDSYEISLVPTSLAAPHSEEDFRLILSDPTPSETLPTRAVGLNLAANVTEGHTNKRIRIPSEDAEERRIRDAVAKELPKYCSAKVFRDIVVKKKEELEAMRQKTERFAIRTSSLPAA
jgi:serine/threonine protein kinase